MEQTYKDRLAELLDPRDAPEQATIEYLAQTTPRQGAIVISLLSAAVSAARAEGYDRGWREGVEHADRAGRLIGRAEDLDVIERPTSGDAVESLLDADTDRDQP
jgi:hypothetical protein